MVKLKLLYFGIGKDPDAGWQNKGATEDEMVRQHQQLNGDECEQTPGDSGAWRNLACCSPRGRKESDATW